MDELSLTAKTIDLGSERNLFLTLYPQHDEERKKAINFNFRERERVWESERERGKERKIEKDR